MTLEVNVDTAWDLLRSGGSREIGITTERSATLANLLRGEYDLADATLFR